MSTNPQPTLKRLLDVSYHNDATNYAHAELWRVREYGHRIEKLIRQMDRMIKVRMDQPEQVKIWEARKRQLQEQLDAVPALEFQAQEAAQDAWFKYLPLEFAILRVEEQLSPWINQKELLHEGLNRALVEAHKKASKRTQNSVNQIAKDALEEWEQHCEQIEQRNAGKPTLDDELNRLKVAP